MSSERERRRLQDIVYNIDKISSYVAGLDFAQFAAEPMRIDAVERCLQRITEAVIKIGPQRMAEISPDLPVAAVRGLGNLLRHDYDRVSLEIIYATVTDRLPSLRTSCAEALTDS
jgi:uncharacterized protein with HEPN domain